MKIIYLHQYFNTLNMSGGTRSFEMAKRMVDAGHEVEMITSNRDMNAVQGDWFETSESGIKVHWLPLRYSNHMNIFQRLIAFFRFATYATFKAIDLKGDVLFATSTPLTIAIPAVIASKKNKTPLVFEVRDLWPEMPIAMGYLKNPILKFLACRLEHFAYFNSAAVVALSPGMKEGIERTGYQSNKIVVIPNGCDNDKFLNNSELAITFRQSRAWLGSRPLLVYLGTFGRLNNVGYMVKLAEELLKIRSEVRLLLIGDGQERNSLMFQAKNSGVFEKNLYFEETIPKKYIPHVLSAATMASSLFQDIEEMQANSANKFFDSLAAAKPVFLNYGGWMHELVIKNDCGLAMWREPLSEVAKLVDEKLQDKTWLESAGLRARKLAEQHFDRDDLARRLISVLEAVHDGKADGFDEFSPVRYL